MFCFECHCYPRELNVLTHPFPTRRSSDLRRGGQRFRGGVRMHSSVLSCFHILRSSAAVAGDPPSDTVPPALRAPSPRAAGSPPGRSEEHTSELQSLMRISYAVFFLKKTNTKNSQAASDSQERSAHS